MNILVFEWNTFGQRDLEESLMNMGFKVDKIRYAFCDFETDEVFEKKLSDIFMSKQYDYVVSFNFFQLISKVCNTFCVKYIAWVFDSPHINLYSYAIYNPYNYIFIFDRSLYLEIKNVLKADTVYYMPLAVNVDRLDNMTFSDDDKEKYSSDISFVGSLYDNRSHYDEIPELSKYLKGYFDGIMNAQMKIYGYNFIRDMLTDEIMDEVCKYISIKPGKYFIGNTRDIFADRFLNSKLTGMERRSILRMLSDSYNVTLYTDSDAQNLINTENRGWADYYNEMPKVFRYSKININITVRTIKSGIPLRVFDIMGAGGFLITNYQADIMEYFEAGRELVVYESEEDLMAKVDYYLCHDAEREEIARNGYLKVKAYHNYRLRLRQILDITGGRYIVNDCASANDDIHNQAIHKKEAEISDGTDIDEPDDIMEIVGQVYELIDEGSLLKAKNIYYSIKRICPDCSPGDMFNDLDMMFIIYSYEIQRGQHTLFDACRSLNKVWEHYTSIKEYILRLERADAGAAGEFPGYCVSRKVSYTAILHIVCRYVPDRVRLLNIIAKLFMDAGVNDMVLPFLSQAYEYDSKDDVTLYHLALMLYRLEEYEAAFGYIDKITIASPEAKELMSIILSRI